MSILLCFCVCVCVCFKCPWKSHSRLFLCSVPRLIPCRLSFCYFVHSYVHKTGTVWFFSMKFSGWDRHWQLQLLTNLPRLQENEPSLQVFHIFSWLVWSKLQEAASLKDLWRLLQPLQGRITENDKKRALLWVEMWTWRKQQNRSHGELVKLQD